MKWRNLLKDSSGSYWWKDEGEWLEKFVMCKGDRLMHQWEWLIIQFKGMKGDRGRPRITLV